MAWHGQALLWHAMAWPGIKCNPCLHDMPSNCVPASPAVPADPQRVADAWRAHPLISCHGLRVAVLPQGACLAADLPHCGERSTAKRRVHLRLAPPSRQPSTRHSTRTLHCLSQSPHSTPPDLPRPATQARCPTSSASSAPCMACAPRSAPQACTARCAAAGCAAGQAGIHRACCAACRHERGGAGCLQALPDAGALAASRAVHVPAGARPAGAVLPRPAPSVIPAAAGGAQRAAALLRLLCCCV